MKQKYIVLFMTSALILCLFCGLAACSDSKERAIENVMKKIPEYVTSVRCWDIELMSVTDNIARFRDELSYTIEKVVHETRIELDDVSHITVVDDYPYVEGNFNYAEIRNELGVPIQEYRGIDIWEIQGLRGNENIALIENLIVFGDDIADIEARIDTIKGDKKSLWDTGDVREVIIRLPDGFRMEYSTVGNSLFKDLTAGSSIEKKGDMTITVTTVVVYKDEASANDATEEVEELLDSSETMQKNTVKQDGKFLVVSYVMDIKDWSR